MGIEAIFVGILCVASGILGYWLSTHIHSVAAKAAADVTAIVSKVVAVAPAPSAPAVPVVAPAVAPASPKAP